MRKDRHSEKGFTLVEVIIALAAIGIMMAAFTATKATIRTAQVTNAMQGIETIASGANQYLQTSGTNNYGGISLSVLDTQKLVPSGITSATANPWGGSYAVSAINSNADFQVVLTSVPTEASTRITSGLGNNTTVTYDSTTSTLTVKYDK